MPYHIGMAVFVYGAVLSGEKVKIYLIITGEIFRYILIIISCFLVIYIIFTVLAK